MSLFFVRHFCRGPAAVQGRLRVRARHMPCVKAAGEGGAAAAGAELAALAGEWPAAWHMQATPPIQPRSARLLALRHLKHARAGSQLL